MQAQSNLQTNSMVHPLPRIDEQLMPQNHYRIDSNSRDLKAQSIHTTQSNQFNPIQSSFPAQPIQPVNSSPSIQPNHIFQHNRTFQSNPPIEPNHSIYPNQFTQSSASIQPIDPNSINPMQSNQLTQSGHSFYPESSHPLNPHSHILVQTQTNTDNRGNEAKPGKKSREHDNSWLDQDADLQSSAQNLIDQVVSLLGPLANLKSPETSSEPANSTDNKKAKAKVKALEQEILNPTRESLDVPSRYSNSLEDPYAYMQRVIRSPWMSQKRTPKRTTRQNRHQKLSKNTPHERNRAEAWEKWIGNESNSLWNSVGGHIEDQWIPGHEEPQVGAPDSKPWKNVSEFFHSKQDNLRESIGPGLVNERPRWLP